MQKNRSRIKVPGVFVLLSLILLLSVIMSYFMPSGEYETTRRMVGGMEQDIVVPGTYKQLPKHISLKGVFIGDEIEGKASPVSLWQLLLAIPHGFIDRGVLLIFILILGGVYGLIIVSGTINAIILSLTRRFSNRAWLLILAIYSIILFEACILGGGIQYLPLIPVFLLIAKRYGYDRIFGLAILAFPFLLGWASALTNPFNLLLAQGIAQVPAFSGFGLRLVILLLLAGSGFLFLMNYGRRIINKPARSFMSDDPFTLDMDLLQDNQKLEKHHIWIGSILVSGILLSIILIFIFTLNYFVVMTTNFLFIGLATIFIGKMSWSESGKGILSGMKKMVLPSVIIGFASAIPIVLGEGKLIHTMLYHSAEFLEGLPRILAAEGMFLFQSLFNLLVPNSMGQALISMPLMAPLSDLLGLSHQIAVLAFMLGDGLSNLIYPTVAILMAMLQLAGIPYRKWVQFIWPFFLITTLIGFIAMGAAVLIGY